MFLRKCRTIPQKENGKSFCLQGLPLLLAFTYHLQNTLGDISHNVPRKRPRFIYATKYNGRYINKTIHQYVYNNTKTKLHPNHNMLCRNHVLLIDVTRGLIV